MARVVKSYENIVKFFVTYQKKCQLLNDSFHRQYKSTEIKVRYLTFITTPGILISLNILRL